MVHKKACSELQAFFYLTSIRYKKLASTLANIFPAACNPREYRQPMKGVKVKTTAQE
jgi:hypothetical protein